ncbi:MAG: hypothetical protein QOG28_2306 [Trebonia sp.]|nr:hypothetical protein [Trebonia sp.]
MTITAASIDTHVAKRDNDLRSARYLDTDTHPAITFASTLLTEYPGNRWGLEGDLRNEAGSLLVRRDVTLCFAVEAIRTSIAPRSRSPEAPAPAS